MEESMDILGIGGVALDTIQVVDHLPIRDGFSTVLSTHRMLGGSGVNVLVQAQKLGAQTASISKVSNDDDSRRIIDCLVRDGIDVRGVISDTHGYPAPHCLIYVDGNGEKCLILDGGEGMPALNEEEARLELVDETSVLYLDLNPPELSLKAARQAKELGKKVVLNLQEDLQTVLAKGIDTTFIRRFLRYVDVFAPCQASIRPWSGSDDPQEQISFIRQFFAGTIVLTLADQGVAACDEDGRTVTLPAFDVAVKDTTGAGDAFIGAFMTQLLIGARPLRDSLLFSSACAAMTCQELGAQSSPDFTQASNFLSTHSLEVTHE